MMMMMMGHYHKPEKQKITLNNKAIPEIHTHSVKTETAHPIF